MKATSLIVLIFASLSAACVNDAALTCAGWIKAPTANDPNTFVDRERELARFIVSHNRFGEAKGCWQ